jgi:hypothetical protein
MVEAAAAAVVAGGRAAPLAAAAVSGMAAGAAGGGGASRLGGITGAEGCPGGSWDCVPYSTHWAKTELSQVLFTVIPVPDSLRVPRRAITPVFLRL